MFIIQVFGRDLTLQDNIHTYNKIVCLKLGFLVFNKGI